MEIFVIGQTTMDMYRIEFGNIGNYYILEPLFRELHKLFPEVKIKTTLQLTERFCKAENVVSLPISLYYDSEKNNKKIVEKEIEIAKEYSKYGTLVDSTPYIDEVMKSDLVIDFSGDIWGENSNLLGEDRFYIGVAKDFISQLLGKFTVLFASSPGPFDGKDHFELAQNVFANFDLVANRERVSRNILVENGFDVSKVKSYVCPAFLFEGGIASDDLIDKYINNSSRKTVGFILTGFNFEEGPHNKWPRCDREYDNFLELIEFLAIEKDCDVCLMSHANGFKLPPTPFIQIPGSDFKHVKKLYDLLTQKDIADQVLLVEEILDPWTTKGFISNFDMLISGRIHGAVAGLSQTIPTTIIDYGHEPKAHKILGFAKNIGVEKFMMNPTDIQDMKNKVSLCFDNLEEEKERLMAEIPKAKNKAIDAFKDLKHLYSKS